MNLIKNLKVSHYFQKNKYYCGPAVLEMVFDYFSYHQVQDEIAKRANTNPDIGTRTADMIKSAREGGFFCYINDGSTFFEIKHFLEMGLPVIVNYIEPDTEETHYAVVVGITKRSVILNDPWNGRNFKLKHKDFLNRWHDSRNLHREWIMVVSKEDFKLGKKFSPITF